MSSQSPYPSALSDATGLALWRYEPQPQAALAAGGVEGFALEADDGPAGTVVCACDDGEEAFIVSSGGAWNGGLSTMVPAGLVERVDTAARTVVLRCSLEQIRRAPLFENDRYRDVAFRGELTRYYGSLCRSAVPHLEAAARRAGTLLSFGRDPRGYPQPTVS
jgi:hypothetical protein